MLSLEGVFGMYTGCFCHRCLKSAQLTFENAIKVFRCSCSMSFQSGIFSPVPSIYVCMLLEAAMLWGS